MFSIARHILFYTESFCVTDLNTCALSASLGLNRNALLGSVRERDGCQIPSSSFPTYTSNVYSETAVAGQLYTEAAQRVYSVQCGKRILEDGSYEDIRKKMAIGIRM